MMQITTNEALILRVMKTSWKSTTEITKETGLHYSSVRKALSNLVRKKLVEKSEIKGEQGNPSIYRLTNLEARKYAIKFMDILKNA